MSLPPFDRTASRRRFLHFLAASPLLASGAALAQEQRLPDPSVWGTRTLDLDLRLGWQHEYANTNRPITAALAGAPFAAFTVFGATPQRDSAVVGFSAKTAIAEATQLYLRYDGEIGSGTDNHALNVGVRFSW